MFVGQINNDTALTEIVTWRRIGDKSLSEPMLTRFTDAALGGWGVGVGGWGGGGGGGGVGGGGGGVVGGGGGGR